MPERAGIGDPFVGKIAVELACDPGEVRSAAIPIVIAVELMAAVAGRLLHDGEPQGKDIGPLDGGLLVMALQAAGFAVGGRVHLLIPVVELFPTIFIMPFLRLGLVPGHMPGTGEGGAPAAAIMAAGTAKFFHGMGRGGGKEKFQVRMGGKGLRLLFEALLIDAQVATGTAIYLGDGGEIHVIPDVLDNDLIYFE